MSIKTVAITDFSDELIRLMPRFIKGIFRERTDVLGKGTITLPQFLTLDFLDKNEPLKMKVIANELSISLPAATGLIDRLVGMEMVKRGQDTQDRRVIYITLTKRGKKAVNNVRNTRRKVIENVFGKLTVSERTHYMKIVKKLVTILEGTRHE
ncbi:MarR family winged helix-turn-helix transcriptional regulator [Chlamydiota bacterium]